jgi:hypothetical protein
LACLMEKREGRVVSSASSNNGTGQGGLGLDPVNPLGAMSGTTPPGAGAPRAEGIVVVEDQGSTILAEEMR